MQTKEPCLPADLRSWLLEPFSEDESQKWSRHVETCPRCRERIEEEPSTLAWPKILSHDEWDHEFSSSHELPKKPTNSNAIDQASLEKFARLVVEKSDNPAMLGRLGEFEILEPIGMGGMSLVLKGYDHELNRYVAIKVLAPHLAMVGVAKQRFAREAQAAASIVDPHVVPIHSVAADHDPPYLVMMFVPGQTLQATIDSDGALDVLASVRIAQQVAMGLSAAHAQGLIHRDIKPSNILLERNVQRAYIADFGLARAADDASLTRSGFLAGTPDYMSPEQARGEAIDERSDLFSLGSVFYAMLTGHPPFRAASPMAVLNRISQDTPRPILSTNPRVPIWLSEFIERLLSKLPADRFSSAREVAKLLEAGLRHLQDPVACSLPAALTKHAQVENPRRFRPRTIGACVSLFLSCVAIAALWLPLRNDRANNQIPFITVSGDSTDSDSGNGSVAAPMDSPATTSDSELNKLFSSLDKEIDSLLEQLRRQVLQPPVESPIQEPNNASEAIDREFLDGIQDLNQQIDHWLLELNTKGKS